MKLGEFFNADMTPELVTNRVNDLLAWKAQVCFAQHGEDLFILSHLLSIPEAERGTFFDFGAHHPTRFSNTYGMYLHGWRGVNVEPNPDQIPAFRDIRPNDITLNIAVSPQAGMFRYRRYKDPAYNKLIPAGAENFTDEAGAPFVDELEVPARTANEILQQFASDRSIDLLSVDIEGMDDAVLQSIDFNRFRPRLLCAELPTKITESAGFRSWLSNVRYQDVGRIGNSAFFKPI